MIATIFARRKRLPGCMVEVRKITIE